MQLLASVDILALVLFHSSARAWRAVFVCMTAGEAMLPYHVRNNDESDRNKNIYLSTHIPCGRKL